MVIGALLSGCVQFKPMSLYDGLEAYVAPPKPVTVASVVEPIIFRDKSSDMWGLETDSCKKAKLTSEVTHSGTEAIDLQWDRNAGGCIFAGIGIGWDGYVGKDLTSLMDYAAIQFYVRSKSGRMFGLPIVLTLEDYSGGMGFAYTDNKYFERTTIDEEWQRVAVPLKDFDMKTENLDPSNIKQLQLELQQSGDIYLDDIELVFFEQEPMVPWMFEEILPDPLATPIAIFDDGFVHGNSWGMLRDKCQNFGIEGGTTAKEGAAAIHATWEEKDDCRLMAFGASWNNWRPIDFTDVLVSKAFTFYIKMASGSASSLPVNVGMEDYDRKQTMVRLDGKYVEGGTYDSNWRLVKIPLSDLPKNFDFTHAKQLMFTFEDSGEVYIDDIQFVGI